MDKKLKTLHLMVPEILVLAYGLPLFMRNFHEWVFMRLLAISLSTVVLNSRDRQGMYGMQHFRAPINKPYSSL